MPFLISFITGTGGKILIKILPYILIIAAIGGAYLYGHARGTQACHDKELQAVIDAQNAKLAEMQKQYEDAQRVIGNLTTSNSKLNDINRTTSAKIANILASAPNQKGCQINKEVIDLINQSRSGASPQGAKK